MLDLLGPVVVVPGLLLEAPDDLVQLISLRLQRLHLLPDGVHCVVVVESGMREVSTEQLL